CRTLEFHAGRNFRRHRRIHAGRSGTRRSATGTLVLAGEGPAQVGGAGYRGAAAMSALVINNLSKSFGGLRVTRNVNLNVEPGERRLIIGPNGAGKTTLFNLITGELAPDAGSVSLFDRDITRMASRKRTHLGMARTYQIITLFARDTIQHNVTLALLGLSPLRWNPVAVLCPPSPLSGAGRDAPPRVGPAPNAP